MFRARFVFAAFLAVGSSCAYGANVVTVFTLDNGIAGVESGQFSIGSPTLAEVNNLSGSGNSFHYWLQFFEPSLSSTYIFGMSSAPIDTVLVLYQGAFDPLNPSVNALALNDDYENVRPDGVTVTTCGDQATTCPQLTQGLLQGTRYTVVVTTYSAATPIPPPITFYVYGEPIGVGGEPPVDSGSGGGSTDTGGGSSGGSGGGSTDTGGGSSGGSGGGSTDTGGGGSFPSLSDVLAGQGSSPALGVAQVIERTTKLKALFVVSGFTTNQQVVRAVSQTLPLLTGGSIMATQSSLSGINKIIQARIDSNRGLSSGDGFFEDRYIWMKPFGSWARQNDHKGVAGYRMDAHGLVAGIDGAVSPALRFGLAFAYADVRIKNNRVLAPQKLDIATHQLVAYGSYNIDHRTELNVQADIGLNRNKGNRAIEFTASQASSSYQSQVAHAGTGIGRSYPVGAGWSFSPSVRADYTWIRDSSYMETGAGILNLDVKSRSAKSFLMSTDSKISYHVSDAVTLTGQLGLGYDAFNERSSITATFAGEPGSSFITYGTPAVPWVTTAGLGMRYRTDEGMEITGRYDSEYRGGFSSQSASIKVRWTF